MKAASMVNVTSTRDIQLVKLMWHIGLFVVALAFSMFFLLPFTAI